MDSRTNGSKEPVPELPRTLIEILYDDVTVKTKSVALSAVFGPSYETGIKHMEKLASEHGGDISDVRATIARVLTAKDPDEFAP